MNPIVLKFADGTAFFVALVVVCSSALILLAIRRRRSRSICTVLVLSGTFCIFASSTALPYWTYVLWLIPVVSALVLSNFAIASARMRLIAGILVFAATVGLILTEAPYHFMPTISVGEGTSIYVLGDSISAGMGRGEHCWPDVLNESTNLTVVNLALPGATARSAIKQANGIVHPRSIVIVEIGGNDMLGDTDDSDFRDQLDSLIAKLSSQQHRIVMFELPLLPFRHSFGRAQREIAAKYQVDLMPKHVLSGVVGLRDATLDGLHLSQAGHDELARIIGLMLGCQSEQR
jgi:acyl-CoA thioesterase-1